MESTKTNVIISTNQISVNVSDVSGSDSAQEQTAFLDKTNVTNQQRIFLNLDVGAGIRMRRRSAPSLTSIQESPIEINLLSKPLLLADINRPPTPTTSKNFLTRPSNVSLRRGSCPAILEPIREGLFSEHDMQATARAARLSPNLNRQSRKSSTDQPHVSQRLVIAEHQSRLRSNSSPISIETKKLLAMETFFPRPRRNSLGCATLDELKGQYKLLDSRSKVQEEEASLDTSSACNFKELEPRPPRAMTLSGSV